MNTWVNTSIIMPNSKNKNGKRVKQSQKHEIANSDQTDLDVTRDIPRNSNSNHSWDGTKSDKRQKLDIDQYCRRQNKKNLNSDEDQSQDNADQAMAKSSNLSKGKKGKSKTATEVVEFQEEDEIIHMEIDDGGAAAAEFASDEEGEIACETDTDEDASPDQDTELPSQERGKTSTTETEQDFEPEYAVLSQVVYKRKVIEKRRETEEKRWSVEQKLDDMSSTLEAMKQFFVNSSFMNEKDQATLNDRNRKESSIGRRLRIQS